jgi:hypothetical protein
VLIPNFRSVRQRWAKGLLPNCYQLGSRPGERHYPLIVEAVEALPVRSCVIDGEAVACDWDGLSIFEKLRWRHHDERAFMWCFDLLELNGRDLRREPIELRKAGAGPAVEEGAGWLAVQRAHHGAGRHRPPARLQARPGGHRLEAAGVSLRFRPLAHLAQVQEPISSGGEARARGGLG